MSNYVEFSPESKDSCFVAKAPNSLTLDYFQVLNDARSQKAFPECKDWQPNDWATALAGEVGELCNILKKIKRGELNLKDDKVYGAVAKELADIYAYTDMLATNLNVWLAGAVWDKFNEVSDKRNCEIKLGENNG